MMSAISLSFRCLSNMYLALVTGYCGYCGEQKDMVYALTELTVQFKEAQHNVTSAKIEA